MEAELKMLFWSGAVILNYNQNVILTRGNSLFCHTPFQGSMLCLIAVPRVLNSEQLPSFYRTGRAQNVDRSLNLKRIDFFSFFFFPLWRQGACLGWGCTQNVENTMVASISGDFIIYDTLVESCTLLVNVQVTGRYWGKEVAELVRSCQICVCGV